MNPIASNFKSFQDFHKHALQITNHLVEVSADRSGFLLDKNGLLRVRKGYLINDKLQIERKNSILNCVKRILQFLTIGLYKPFLCYRIDRVVKSIINEVDFYQKREELCKFGLDRTVETLMALDIKTKGKHRVCFQKVFQEKIFEYLAKIKEEEELDELAEKIWNELEEGSKNITNINATSTKPSLKDADVQNKQNAGLFDENASPQEREKQVLKQKKKIENYHKKRSLFSNLFGSWFGNKAANFSSEINY